MFYPERGFGLLHLDLLEWNRCLSWPPEGDIQQIREPRCISWHFSTFWRNEDLRVGDVNITTVKSPSLSLPTVVQEYSDVRKVIIRKVRLLQQHYWRKGDLFLPNGVMCDITTGSMWLPGHQCSRWGGQSPWQRASFHRHHGHRRTGSQVPAVTGERRPWREETEILLRLNSASHVLIYFHQRCDKAIWANLSCHRSLMWISVDHSHSPSWVLHSKAPNIIRSIGGYEILAVDMWRTEDHYVAAVLLQGDLLHSIPALHF